VIGFLKDWRRKRAIERVRIDPALWERVTNALAFLDGLNAEELARLYQLTVAFLAEKEMHGAGDFTLSDEIRLSIAVQACLPILNLGLDCYDGWIGIVVYPGEFRVRREEIDEDGVLHEWDDALAGEAMPGGPVVLSWEDVDLGEVGYNVVIHEFAHKLDMLSGDADGYPPAPVGFPASEWRACLERESERFRAEAAAAERAARRHGDFDFDFDPYAAEHPAEFFAVMSEAFFTEPRHLRERYPELYQAFSAFYRQDPALRLPT
jgi:MtfA peptidase